MCEKIYYYVQIMFCIELFSESILYVFTPVHSELSEHVTLKEDMTQHA